MVLANPIYIYAELQQGREEKDKLHLLLVELPQHDHGRQALHK
jgi:hypothetical protein